MLGIRPMTIEDIPVGRRLVAQAGWNQLEADWRRLLDLQPGGGFVAELDGVGVGTVTTCRFGPVAWVAMMLVDEAHRGSGIGRALMTRALESLDAQGVSSVRLDATPLGRPLYEDLGFVAEATLDRHRGILSPADGTPGEARVRTAGHPDLEAAIALDREATGTDRGRLIRRLADEQPDAFRVVGESGRLRGFLLSRPGASARQIGPCLGDDLAGPALLADARSRYAGETVILDIPTVNVAAQALAGSWGLRAERVLLRMGRGPRVAEDLSRTWAGSGPEKG
ncbi:GNAT family N-acetyltransferase [Aquisphaera insulae]|uniref:GNAT family N-acetyltransferase n=1 Tax=Aquisphaera insulae TaxID=2712864 RepID=UPI0013EBC071|nr:GNAT family N-acetyltransferase [Aquisphaera insulae]